MAWISVANSLTVSAQQALPDWVRARGMSIYQMALMGGTAAGALLWGRWPAGQRAGGRAAAAAGGLRWCCWLTRRLTVDWAADDRLHARRDRTGSVPEPAIEIGPDEGPVMVTVEYQIDPARAADFAAVMERTRRARLRQGALSWGLFRDTAVPGRYVEYFVDENWVEHQRRLERFTAFDAELRASAWPSTSAKPPVLRRYVADAQPGAGDQRPAREGHQGTDRPRQGAAGPAQLRQQRQRHHRPSHQRGLQVAGWAVHHPHPLPRHGAEHPRPGVGQGAPAVRQRGLGPAAREGRQAQGAGHHQPAHRNFKRSGL
jgi:quinol monooxygenase YgiN